MNTNTSFHHQVLLKATLAALEAGSPFSVSSNRSINESQKDNINFSTTANPLINMAKRMKADAELMSGHNRSRQVCFHCLCKV